MILLIVSSPSGCGKSTLCRYLREKFPGIRSSVSVTTRKPRPHEVEGVDYYFKSHEECVNIEAEGGFIETTEFCGNFYGTLKSEVMRIAGDKSADCILFDIDVRGAIQIKNQGSLNVVSVFIIPPSMDALKARLLGRKTESAEVIEMRLQQAKNEMRFAKEYDYIVLNDDLDTAKRDIESIYIASKLKYSHAERELAVENMII